MDDQLVDITGAAGDFSGASGVELLFALNPHLKIYHTCNHQFSLFGIRMVIIYFCI